MTADWTVVIVAALGVIGTLGGIWLGHWLQDRRRYDDTRRDAYARFVTVTRQVMADVSRNADNPQPGESAESVPGLAREVWDTLTTIQIVGR